ncbi:PHD finger protein rhinoceros isoform X2 [Cephus cinctus]|uniref:PHD finger protein rhinoceros isoform X2 n=1 Tax=Cephus cinctus TaxID=211228 RepID=A0AAJ7FMC1_CEPCN|nr:PHD finger protein rhinoceros isoform X2 [Cephus cinctus]
MSAQCTHFVQNAWKKELCSNCFKPKEEHLVPGDATKFNVGKSTIVMKVDSHKLQSILKGNTSSQTKKKKVAFPDTLTEIIGYGGDDFSDSEEFELSESTSLEDETPDSEEERALSNLTRANTNFNTIIANLSEVAPQEAKKSFASLMLGKVQKDADGKKKTLLVSVTPFGGDCTVPTAKRPSDKKVSHSNLSKKCGDVAGDGKTEVTLKSVRSTEEKVSRNEKQGQNESLEKIVDMPLITSSNLISVIQKSDTLTGGDVASRKSTESLQKSGDGDTSRQIHEKKTTSITRTPAIKKTESEKPKISMQNSYSKSEYIVAKVTKQEDFSRVEETSMSFSTGIELTLTPLSKPSEKVATRNAENEEKSILLKGKDVNKVTVVGEEKHQEVSTLDDREVEGQAAPESLRKFSFEESRELAGEPDGKADEEVGEPPALPRSPPPIDSRPSRSAQGEKKNEPRSSFLHGGDAKTKPVVPQKPVSLPPKPTGLPKSPTSSIGPSFKKTITTSYVLPPPSIQNAALQGSLTTRNNLGDKTQSVASSLQSSSSVNSAARYLQSQTVKAVQVSLTEVRSSQKIFDDSAKTKSDNTSSQSSSASGSTKVAPKLRPPALTIPRSLQNDQEEDDEEEDDSSGISAEVTAELIRSPNKRRMAPKPPATPTEELPGSLFARNPSATVKSDSPVVREKEKRERASSCSPKFRKAVSETPDPCIQTPEPAPRRTISLSQDSLANPDRLEEKKKTRSRFSLKKFLRMGSKKDADMIPGGSSPKIDEIPSTPQPKQRLEIIHPLELDGAAVEVVSSDRIGRIGSDVTDSKAESIQSSHQQSTSNAHHVATRPGKPPPPPRNQSLDDWSRLDPANKPARPPPPRTDSKLPPRGEKPSPKTWQPTSTPSSASDSIYANLGEVRSALAPSKPQRTASMRDQAMSLPPLKKRTAASQPQSQDYETVGSAAPPMSDSPTSNDSHAYECLSSSPECDLNIELRHGNGNRENCKRKSDSSALDPNVEFKYHHQPFIRSTSLPYCGSETESELYAPYSFYTGDEGPEDDQDWKNKDDESRVSRLRQRRGRGIVHRSLEDNYGAVIVANHEALAQLLEQLNQVSPVAVGLRGLKAASPRFTDFHLDTSSPVPIGRRIFYSATWNEHSVTLCIAFDLALHVSRKEFYLVPIVEFMDSVPEDILEKTTLSGITNLEATISVLPRLQVNTIQSFAAISKDSKDDNVIRESSFILLQFVNALKSLQARGIEESPKNLSNVVLCREDKDACYRLYLLQGLNMDVSDEREEERVSLCQCALVALQELFLTSKLPLIQELLIREKAVTLSQVKSVLEFSLWGPADTTLGGPREREVVLQRWLDLERATVLHALVRARAPLTVTDEYHLLFLVRTSAKMMCEASILLDRQRNTLARAS